MVSSAVLGFPRIGANRELKKITEAYWSGKTSVEELQKVAKQIRADNWQLQKSQGVEVIPSNDFSLYDQVLDHSLLFNVVPQRYVEFDLPAVDLLFAMGRGLQRPARDGKPAVDVVSQEMVKWFDSNYHFMRPEIADDTQFKINVNKPLEEYLEAKELGVETRPVLIGPVTFLYLSKTAKGSSKKPLESLSKLIPVYQELLGQLKSAGAEWVQIDEPILVYELESDVTSLYADTYAQLSTAGPKLMLTSYFDAVTDVSVLKGLKVHGIHADLVSRSAAHQLDAVLANISDSQVFSAGVVSGRDIWKVSYERAIATVKAAVEKLGSDRVQVATSSSLLHCPVNLESEKKIAPELYDFFAFAKQKVAEVATIARAVNGDDVSAELEANAKSMAARKSSKITNNATVQERVAAITAQQGKRISPFESRDKIQRESLKLPDLPTTTIGSFPQTKDIRIARQKFTKGEISPEEYERFIEKEIQAVVKFQDEVGLDVYVHGEPERNDMVQYFGERMNGFAFTTNGWVQSFGSRYVRPPLIVGDIDRPAAMTVKESVYAQSLTSKPMKGMLTGPVTILRWSFRRDDVSEEVQAKQLALALRDEVNDLEKGGINVIQVDEPALREGCPLKRSEWDAYFAWAVESFRLATAGVQDATQIHSHFCYSDFNEIFDAIEALDTDVLSCEASKSDLKLLDVFKTKNYKVNVGPGLFDIHSPRVPKQQEFDERIAAMAKVVPHSSLWLNPDCGLKTRTWEECTAQLQNMVAAARAARA
ncbi:methionine-synthesizing 5-methyltetrahydropteroyltriglutamate--homocysteine methyltransferase [Savitreella phatthalungensis]